LYYCAKQEVVERKVIIFRQESEGQHIKKNAIIINTGLLLSAESRKVKENRKAFYFQLSNY